MKLLLNFPLVVLLLLPNNLLFLISNLPQLALASMKPHFLFVVSPLAFLQYDFMLGENYYRQKNIFNFVVVIAKSAYNKFIKVVIGAIVDL